VNPLLWAHEAPVVVLFVLQNFEPACFVRAGFGASEFGVSKPESSASPSAGKHHRVLNPTNTFRGRPINCFDLATK